MSGILDFLAPKDSEFMTGYYYDRRPAAPEDGRIVFKYSRLDPYFRSFDTELGQMRLDRESYSLKTRASLPWKVKGYISTQDGRLWQIMEIAEDNQPKGTEEVLRLFRTAPETDYTIRLLKVDNPWGIGT